MSALNELGPGVVEIREIPSAFGGADLNANIYRDLSCILQHRGGFETPGFIKSEKFSSGVFLFRLFPPDVGSILVSLARWSVLPDGL